MATQVMYRSVGESLLRLMPSPGMPLVEFTIPTIALLATGCVDLMSKVEKLQGSYGYGPVQMLRMVAVAHGFRFLQSILGENQVPLSFYLRKVLPFYDLPITLAIAGFYISSGIFPDSLCYVPVLVLFLLLFVLAFTSKVPTQASPSNTEPVDYQNNAADILIIAIMGFFHMEPKDTSGIEVIDHFAIILLTGMCVDLVVQVERVRGTYELILMVLVLAGRHVIYIIQYFAGPNNVPPVYYLRKVLLFYDIPFTVTFAAFYINFETRSDTLMLVLILEVSLLTWIHKSIARRESLNITQGTEREQDTRPTQPSSSNTEEFPPQQNHDAANNAISSPQNLSQRDICDTPIGDGGSPSVHDASNRVNRDLGVVVKEEDAAAANSISETTDFSTWKKGKCIGAGGFGSVYVLHDRKTGRSCAVKQLIDIHNTRSIEFLKKEINILSQLKRHPNIVKYYGHKKVRTKLANRFVEAIYLYMEYIEQGSLKQYISKSKRGVLDEPLIRNFTAQILKGLVFLHKQKVVHRDLKPDNILVDSGDIVKLVDFGLAKKLAESMGKHSVLGTPYYTAPEVFEDMEYKRSCDASAADIWSLGCIIIEMFSGKHPWSDLIDAQVIFQVSVKKEHPPIPKELCSEGKDFLKDCFTRNPKQRPSAVKLLRRPFVKAHTC